MTPRYASYVDYAEWFTYRGKLRVEHESVLRHDVATSVEVYLCDRCGALVETTYFAKHVTWHRELTGTTQVWSADDE